MADNLKVNAKSKILTFKKKHNLLVDNMNSLLPPITESDIGKVLGVNDDGELEFQEISGGTKLYRHNIEMFNGGIGFSIISTKSTEYSISDFVNILRTGVNCIAISQEVENDAWLFIPANISIYGNKLYCENGNQQYESDDDVESLVDFITPL